MARCDRCDDVGNIVIVRTLDKATTVAPLLRGPKMCAEVYEFCPPSSVYILRCPDCQGDGFGYPIFLKETHGRPA